MIGSSKTVYYNKNTNTKMNVIVTGGTRGLGKSFVKTFTQDGHKVIFTSRNEPDIISTMTDLNTPMNLVGVVADVSQPAYMTNIIGSVEKHMPDGIDIWINNAAVSDGNTPFVRTKLEKVKEIVDTNLFGTIVCTQAALNLMSNQEKMGHIFNMAGAGSDGSPSPEYAVYGSTKAGLVQFTKSLQKELVNKNVGLHILSPGLMATDMLAENLCDKKRVIYNILCEDPDVIAKHLLPTFKSIVKNKASKEYVRYLTPMKIIYRFASANQRTDRFFL